MFIDITDDFDLQKIAESGQCFRWQSIQADTYRIIHMEKCLYIEKSGKTKYQLDCTAEEYEAVWKPYFDLQENYQTIRNKIDKEKDSFLYAAATREKGIRILCQDTWETLISFIISQNRNIPAIKMSIEKLAAMAGEKKTDQRENDYYTFPSPKAVADLDEEDLKECRLGYRWKYVKAAARDVADGKMNLLNLKEMQDEEALQSLTSLYGVGAKVASCVLLYGLHHLNAFPVDVWIKKVLEREYPKGYPFSDYSPYNGVYQQYMFAYYRNLNEI